MGHCRKTAVWFLLLAGALGGCQRSTDPDSTPNSETVAVPQDTRADENQQSSAGEQQRHAVLVGCTNYESTSNAGSFEGGPTNDVRILAETLTGQFGFASEDIVELSGWPEDEKRRPTYANIVEAIETQIRRATATTHLIIHLSGHGARQPIATSQDSPNSPENVEPDGKDEVFLPSDARLGSDGRYANGITDNQIGQWLNELRSKGAHTWVIFDCCHSGTLTKGNERTKGVFPADAKTEEPASWEPARREASSFSMTPASDMPGSVVAFYASQPFEETPVLPRPRGAEDIPENNYSLFTYSLVRALQQPRQRPLTYRELAQELATAYQAERKTRGPTPFCEGDVDREVLGNKIWSGRSEIRLSAKDDFLSINAGQLAGLTSGSVLSVHPPAGLAGTDETTLGFVLVKTATALGATVESCDSSGQAVKTPLPDKAECRLHSRAFSDGRLKLAIVANETSHVEEVRAILQRMPAESQELIALTHRDEADWLLRFDGDFLVLSPRLSSARPRGAVSFDDVSSSYANAEEAQLPVRLSRDLGKIFVWQNAWRVASALSGHPDSSHLDLRCNFRPIIRADALPPLSGHRVHHPGQLVELEIDNRDGLEDLWIAVVHLSADMSIEVLHTESVGKFGKLEPLVVEITDDSYGSEGLVVFALSMKQQKLQPQFAFLTQTGLGASDSGTKGASPVPTTLFDELLGRRRTSDGAKGSTPDVASEPAAYTYSWMTLPAEPAIQPGHRVSPSQ